MFEARVFEVVPSRRFERIGKFSYDQHNERFRIVEELDFGNETERYDELFLHQEVCLDSGLVLVNEPLQQLVAL